MKIMFAHCSSFNTLNIRSFNIEKLKYIYGIFKECSEELKSEIKTQNYELAKKSFSLYVLNSNSGF